MIKYIIDPHLSTELNLHKILRMAIPLEYTLTKLSTKERIHSLGKDKGLSRVKILGVTIYLDTWGDSDRRFRLGMWIWKNELVTEVWETSFIDKEAIDISLIREKFKLLEARIK